MRAILAAALVLSGCNPCPYHNFQSIGHYDIRDYRESRTSSGVKVLVNDQSFDVERVDKAIRELESCLGVTIRRDCLKVLIPDDWWTSPTSGQQLLPLAAPPKLCRDKRLDVPDSCAGVVKPTTSCPRTCNWRVALQWNQVVVTVPSLVLLKAEVARWHTGVNNVWSDPAIRKCL